MYCDKYTLLELISRLKKPYKSCGSNKGEIWKGNSSIKGEKFYNFLNMILLIGDEADE
jgi:hypothetical protein